MNEIKTFEFHDANLNYIKFIGTDMICNMSAVCISTENSCNDKNYDISADEVEMTFKNVKILNIIKPGFNTYDFDNKLIRSVKARPVPTAEYGAVFDLLSRGATLYYGGYDGDNYIFEINDYGINFFNISLNFEQFTAEWEYTSQKAWYVK